MGVRFVDVSDSQTKWLEDLLKQLEKPMEDNVGHRVKAVLNSSLGQLDIVGILAVEDFFAGASGSDGISVLNSFGFMTSLLAVWAIGAGFSNVGWGS